MVRGGGWGDNLVVAGDNLGGFAARFDEADGRGSDRSICIQSDPRIGMLLDETNSWLIRLDCLHVGLATDPRCDFAALRGVRESGRLCT